MSDPASPTPTDADGALTPFEFALAGVEPPEDASSVSLDVLADMRRLAAAVAETSVHDAGLRRFLTEGAPRKRRLVPDDPGDRRAARPGLGAPALGGADSFVDITPEELHPTGEAAPAPGPDAASPGSGRGQAEEPAEVVPVTTVGRFLGTETADRPAETLSGPDLDPDPIRAGADADATEPIVVESTSDLESSGTEGASGPDALGAEALADVEPLGIDTRPSSGGLEIDAVSEAGGLEIDTRPGSDGLEIDAVSEADGLGIDTRPGSDGLESDTRFGSDGLEVDAVSEAGGLEIDRRPGSDGLGIDAVSEADGLEVDRRPGSDGLEVDAVSEAGGLEVDRRPGSDGLGAGAVAAVSEPMAADTPLLAPGIEPDDAWAEIELVRDALRAATLQPVDRADVAATAPAAETSLGPSGPEPSPISAVRHAVPAPAWPRHTTTAPSDPASAAATGPGAIAANGAGRGAYASMAAQRPVAAANPPADLVARSASPGRRRRALASAAAVVTAAALVAAGWWWLGQREGSSGEAALSSRTETEAATSTLLDSVLQDEAESGPSGPARSSQSGASSTGELAPSGPGGDGAGASTTSTRSDDSPDSIDPVPTTRATTTVPTRSSTESTTTSQSSTSAGPTTSRRTTTTEKTTTTASPPALAYVGDRVTIGDYDGPGLFGVEVSLWEDSDEDGTVNRQVAQVTTGGDGRYYFDLDAGCYEVRFRPPAGYEIAAGMDAQYHCLGPGEVAARVDAVARAIVAIRQPSGCYVDRPSGSYSAGVEVYEDDADWGDSYTFYDRNGGVVVRTRDMGPPDDIDGPDDYEWFGASNDFDHFSVWSVAAERSGRESEPVVCRRSSGD